MASFPIILQLESAAIDYILPIEQASHPTPWSRELFQREFELPQSKIMGARLGGALVGFVVFHIIVEEIHLLNLSVSPDYRRRGIGRALLARVLEEGINHGSNRVLLEARESNEAAIALYQSAGFKIDGQRPRYYTDSGEAAVLFSRRLPYPESFSP